MKCFLLGPAGLEKETLTFSLCPLGSSYGYPPIKSCSLFTLFTFFYLNSSHIFQFVICLDAMFSGELKSSLISLLLFVLRKPALVSSGSLQRHVLFMLFFNTENPSV